MNEDYIKAIYNELNTSYDLGSIEDFTKNIQNNDDYRKALYDDASKTLDLGDYATFDKNVKKKEFSLEDYAVTPKNVVEKYQESQEKQKPFSIAPSVSPSGEPIEPKEFTTPSTKLPTPEVSKIDVTKPKESLLEQKIATKEPAKGLKENTFAFLKEVNKGLADIFDAADYIQTSVGDAINAIIMGNEAAYGIKQLRDAGALPTLAGKVERPAKFISDAINKSSATAPDLSQNIGGDIAKGVAGVVPLAITSVLVPEVAAGQTLQKLGIQNLSKFGLIMGTQQAIQTSQQTQYGTPLQKWTAPALAGLEGYLTGQAFDNMGALSSKLGSKIANKILPKPITTGDVINKTLVQTGTSNLTNAVFFGGYGNLEEYLQTGKISPETFATNAGIGIAMGIRETGKLLWAKGINSIIATPPDIMSRAMDNPTSAQEFAKEAQDKINLIEKGESTNREADLTSAMINAKMSELKAVADEIKENPDEVIRSVKESTLDEKEKTLIIDKINEAIVANDARAQEAKPFTDQITNIDDNIENIKNNKSLSSVEKDIKIKTLNEQRAELEKNVVDIYNKPTEETTMGTLEKVSEGLKKIKGQINNEKELYDQKIIEAQKRLNLPETPEIFVSDNTEETLSKIDNEEPIVNIRLKEASDELYKEYKRLETMKTSDTKQYTDEQITSMQEVLGEEITNLNNRINEQATTGEFKTKEVNLTDAVKVSEITEIGEGKDFATGGIGEKVEGKPTEEVTQREVTPKEQITGTEPANTKQEQFNIIKESNPPTDEIHTAIRSVDEIKTAEEVFEDSLRNNEDATPDFKIADMKNALDSGEIEVFSSKPIDNGIFVTPSKMEAQSYAGKEKVYSKKISIKDVAWIDQIEGQYAPTKHKQEQIIGGKENAKKIRKGTETGGREQAPGMERGEEERLHLRITSKNRMEAPKTEEVTPIVKKETKVTPIKTTEEFKGAALKLRDENPKRVREIIGGEGEVVSDKEIDDYVAKLDKYKRLEEKLTGTTDFFDSEVTKLTSEPKPKVIKDKEGNVAYMATPGEKKVDSVEDVINEIERLNALVKGVKGEIVRDERVVPEDVKKMAKGAKIIAVHIPGENKSYMFVNNMTSIGQARKAWIHDVLLHGGIERLFTTKEEYGRIMQSVLNNLGGKWKAIDKIVEMGGDRNLYSGMSENQIAEEYLGFLSGRIITDPNLKAEKVLTPQELSVWQNIIKTIKDAIAKFMGVPIELTDADIANLIIDSAEAAKRGGVSFRGAGSTMAEARAKSMEERFMESMAARNEQIAKDYDAIKKEGGDVNSLIDKYLTKKPAPKGEKPPIINVEEKKTSEAKPTGTFERETLRKMRDESTLSPTFKKWLSENDITTTRLPNDVTSKEVDYLISQNGLDKSDGIFRDRNNNLHPAVRNLLGVRLTKAYDDIASSYDKVNDTGNADLYRQKAIETAEWMGKETTDIARGLQILGSTEALSVLSPKTTVIKAEKDARSQRDKQIKDNKKDIDKKSKILKDAQEETVNAVLASDAFRGKKKQTESKYAEQPQTSVPKAKLIEEKNIRTKLWADLKKARAEAKARGESMGLAATPLHAEEVRIAGEITRSLIRSGYYKMEDIVKTIKKEWQEYMGETISDDDVRKLIPANLNNKPIEEHLIDNYNKKATKSLVNRINKMFNDPKARKDNPVVQLVNTLFEKVSEKAVTKKGEIPKKPSIDKIREAIEDKGKYASVWEAAKKEVKDKIDANSELSEEQKTDRTKQLDAFYNEIIGKPYSDKQVQDIVRGGLKEMDTQIDDIIRKHYTVYDATKKTLQDKLIDELGLHNEDAKLLADAISKEFDKIATSKKISALKRGITPREAVHPARTKATWEKLVELSNMGAWSDSELSEAYADKMGLPKLTEENKREIERLASRIQEVPDGEKKFEAIQDLLSYQAKLPGMDLGRVGESMWYSFILSGFRTQFKNIFANNINILSEFAVSARNPKNIPALLLGLSSGTRQGLRAAEHIMKTGYQPIRGTKLEQPTDLELWKFKGGGWNPANWAKYVTRVMMAADAISYHGLKEMRSWELAMDIAKTKDAKAQYPDMGSTKRAMEILNKTNEKLIEYGEQAKSEGLKGKDANRRVWELMEQDRPMDMVDDANNFAARGTFNHAPEGTIGILTELVGFASNNIAFTMPIPFTKKIATIRPLKVFIPFTRIISNVTNVALDYTPYGFVRAAKGGVGVKWYERPEVARTVGKGKYRKYTTDERQRTLTKAIMGVSAMIALYLLSSDREDGKEPAVTITAMGTGDYATNTELTNATGWQPYSLKIGGKWYSYQYTPFFLALAPIGYLRDAEKYQKDKTDAMTRQQKATLMLMQTSRAMMDMSWMTSLTGLMDGLSSANVGSFDNFWQKQTASFAKSMIYPKIVDQTVQFIDYKSKTPRKDSGVLTGKILKDIPIVRNKYNEMLNAVGEPVLYDPVQMMSEATSDPFWEFVVDNNAFIGKPSQKKITVLDGDKERFLTDDEYYDFIRLSGSAIKKRIENEVMNKNLEQKEVVKEVDKIKREERERVRLEMFGWPDLRMKHPDEWKVMKERGGLQSPETSYKILENGVSRQMTKEELKKFNDYAMEEYISLVVPYLKSASEDDKLPMENGKSKFDITISKEWTGAKRIALTRMR